MSGHYLPPVRVCSPATGAVHTVHATQACTLLADRSTTLRTMDGELTYDAGRVAA